MDTPKVAVRMCALLATPLLLLGATGVSLADEQDESVDIAISSGGGT